MMILNDGKGNIFEDFLKAFQKEMKEMGHANLIIAGRTGVGKSTLINSAFRKNLAETGIGKPVTDEMRVYEIEGYPLRLYDTVGFELDPEKQRKTIETIKQECKRAERLNDPDQFIHCMWYCVLSNSNRLEQVEVDFINEIAELMPVVVVLTQVITKKQAEAFKNQILKDYPGIKAKNIWLVLAQDYDDDDRIKPAFGVDTLVEFSMGLLPEAAQKAWCNAQKASIKLKVDKAKKLVMTTAAASFGEGYMPLPFADATALVPTQIGMIAGITAIFGMDISKSLMRAIVTSLLGTAGTTLAGRTIVSNLLKLIPGVGTVVGGTINGATAALLTTALGETYIKIMEMTASGELNEKDLGTEKVQKQIHEMFIDKLKKRE